MRESVFYARASEKLPEGWDLSSTGGGCWSAFKELGDGIGVEIGHEGGVNIFKTDDDERYATLNEVIEENLFPNYVLIRSVSYGENYESIATYEVIEDIDGLFTEEEEKEIEYTATTLAKIYEEER